MLGDFNCRIGEIESRIESEGRGKKSGRRGRGCSRGGARIKR